jgi:hypothetical protein
MQAHQLRRRRRRDMYVWAVQGFFEMTGGFGFYLSLFFPQPLIKIRCTQALLLRLARTKGKEQRAENKGRKKDLRLNFALCSLLSPTLLALALSISWASA